MFESAALIEISMGYKRVSWR